jgi:catechol 2,3-dioxygenase-like lactoylglutathione lyase family enzyme
VKRPAIDQQVTWVYTQDLESTAGFYRDTIGLEQVLDQGLCRIFRTSSTGFLGVCQVRPGRYVEPKGVVLTLVVPDVDGWHTYLTAKGVACEGKPSLSTTFNVYAFFAADPNGYKLEFQSFRDPRWPKA